MRVAELRELVQSLGLETEGLNKQQLRAAIKDHQENAAQQLEAVHCENDEEVDGDGTDGGTTPNTNDVIAANSNAKESNAVLELRLKLRMIVAEKAAKLKLIEAEKAEKREEWEMQKKRMQLMGMQGADGNTQEWSNGSAAGNEFRGLLPKMSDSTDEVLRGFHAFEKCLELHEVNKESWGKLLPAQLSSKATKVRSHFTIAEYKQYDIVKRAILASSRLTAKANLE